MIFTVIIALEIKRSLLVISERRFGLVQVRSVVLIAILAVVRKFIIIDIVETSPSKLAALGGAILALGAVYWLIRDQDIKEAGHEAGVRLDLRNRPDDQGEG